MLNKMTMERLRLMKLRGMSRAFEEQADNPAMQHLSFEERFGLIVDAAWIKRKNNHLLRLLKKRPSSSRKLASRTSNITATASLIKGSSLNFLPAITSGVNAM